MVVPLSQIENSQAGRPAAVLGGGPSLPSDLEKLPTRTILISVNNHALYHCHPDYLVHMDKPKSHPDLANMMNSFEGVVVSPFENSNVILPKGEWWDGGFTSTLATWFALVLGCDPVILCGMDCYQGEVKYCHPRPDFYHPVFEQPLENSLRVWRRAFYMCPNPERIRVMSGPLIEIFGAYEEIIPADLMA